jgi:hypothetical protein
MKKETISKIKTITLFGIAMAFIEMTIVYYIRWIYYPKGFSFPIIGFIDPRVLNVEILREIFTIVMLATIAVLASKKFSERFAYFFYSFAIWDIFYYIWLKLFLNWPSYLLEWDILFLIPWAWASPWIAPVISSITMIIMALIILSKEDNKINIKIRTKEWVLLITGGLLQLFTFVYDYGKIIFSNEFYKEFFKLSTNKEFQEIVGNYIPVYYNWPLFILGEILILVAIYSFYKAKK